MARMGRPKNSSSPQPMAGPMLVRPASRIQAAPRPASHTRTSPTTRVEIETASHQASLPAQPNPFQLVLVCRRLVVPPMVAPEATTGACWETTSPVTLAPERSSTRPLKATTSPLTRPEMVTGASKAVSDPSTVPATSAEPWKTTRSPTCWPSGTSARPERTTNASVVWAACAHAGVVSPSTRRMNSPTIIDRRMPITSNAVSPSPWAGWSTRHKRHDRPDRASTHSRSADLTLFLRKAWRSLSAEGLIERQGFGHALQVDHPTGREVQVMVVGPSGSLLAHHDLSGLCVGGDPGGQVHGLPVHVPVLGDDPAPSHRHRRLPTVPTPGRPTG